MPHKIYKKSKLKAWAKLASQQPQQLKQLHNADMSIDQWKLINDLALTVDSESTQFA